MGTRQGLDFIHRKWLHVIINDDFLEEGECYDRALLPSIICLGRLRIASKYIFNLWLLRQGVDSLAQWLEHWIFNREDRVRFPRKAEYFFSYASFLCYGFHVVRGLGLVYEVLDWFSLQKDIKSVHNNSCFLIFGIKINTLSRAMKTNQIFCQHVTLTVNRKSSWVICSLWQHHFIGMSKISNCPFDRREKNQYWLLPSLSYVLGHLNILPYWS